MKKRLKEEIMKGYDTMVESLKAFSTNSFIGEDTALNSSS